MKNKILVVVVVVVAVFLVSFVPEYVRASRLQSELQQTRAAAAGAEVRDLAGLAYLQVNQKNYGLAADTMRSYFARARALADQTQDAARRKAIEDLLAPRDKITAELAKGDASALGDVQDLFMKTRTATL